MGHGGNDAKRNPYTQGSEIMRVELMSSRSGKYVKEFTLGQLKKPEKKPQQLEKILLSESNCQEEALEKIVLPHESSNKLEKLLNARFGQKNDQRLLPRSRWLYIILSIFEKVRVNEQNRVEEGQSERSIVEKVTKEDLEYHLRRCVKTLS